MTITTPRRLGAVALLASIALAACSSGGASTAPSIAATAAPTTAASVPASSAASTAPSVAPSAAAITYRCTKADGQLNGAGSTFIFPLLSKMGEDYNTKCGVKLNYQSIGSGGGVKQWTNNTVDFGASDAFLQDSEIAAAAANGEPVEIPTTFGAVVVAYNLTGLAAPLKMTPDIIANLFLGKITKWDDPAIAAANPGVTLPSKDVSVVHRSDGSGTTSIFTKYLSAVSPDWVTTVGAGDPAKSGAKEVEWPTGIGASGQRGRHPGHHPDGGWRRATSSSPTPSRTRSRSRRSRTSPATTSCRASTRSTAAADLPSYPADLRFNLVDTEAAQGYPITGTTWIIVYKDLSKVLKSQDRATALVDFLWWAIHDGQADAAPLFYGSIPASLLAQDEAAVKSLNWAGTPLLP